MHTWSEFVSHICRQCWPEETWQWGQLCQPTWHKYITTWKSVFCCVFNKIWPTCWQHLWTLQWCVESWRGRVRRAAVSDCWKAAESAHRWWNQLQVTLKTNAVYCDSFALHVLWLTVSLFLHYHHIACAVLTDLWSSYLDDVHEVTIVSEICNYGRPMK